MIQEFKMSAAYRLSFCLLLFYTSTTLSLPFETTDKGLKSGVMMEMLRAMVNQTKGDSLNLPANASSIRENITDTFSCENRTYGYYADVDNECQVFHVCLTSKAASGRNTTYRWSFICPNETVFNQEVLTCTRPRDSIDCEDSPMYYDRNDDIGKVNSTETDEETHNNSTSIRNSPTITKNKRKESVHKKQNLEIQNVVKETMENELNGPKIEGVKFNDYSTKNTEVMDMNKEVVMPVIDIGISEIVPKDEITEVETPLDDESDTSQNERLFGERSLKRKERRLRKRGSFRFKADV